MPKKIDLTGKKIGRWTVLERAENKGIRTAWLCKCECGTLRAVATECLTKGESNSCGCLHKEINSKRLALNFEDLTGQKFGRLTVLKRSKEKTSRVYWDCLCDCGNTHVASSKTLKNGSVTSCGCFKKHIKHSVNNGIHYKRLYDIWSGMKDRCFNEKSHAYKYYGERGIKVCDEWLDFASFYEWSIINGYEEKLSIERVDVNNNYCPENCKWIPIGEQAKNTRNNVFITYKGETKIQADWAKHFNIHYCIIERYRAKNKLDELFESLENNTYRRLKK